MTAGQPPGFGAMAGVMLITVIVLGVVIGLGLGTLFGAAAILAVAGGALGLVIGFWIVYNRFKNL